MWRVTQLVKAPLEGEMVSALVSALVGGLAGSTLNPVISNVMAQAFKIVEKDRELWEGYKRDIASLKEDLCFLVAEGSKLLGKEDDSDERRTYLEHMQELSYNIEDCMDKILCYSECKRSDGCSSSLQEEVTGLKERLNSLREKQKRISVDGSQPSMPKNKQGKHTVKPNMTVGINEQKDELCKVLESQPEDLSVISIVGFSGMGKTTLAKAVYDFYYDDKDKFDCWAWVVASEHGEEGLVMALQEKLSVKNHLQDGQVQTNITDLLKNKRYLIVLDDVEEGHWHHIMYMLPDGKRSRIIVTTTIQGVAVLCSKHGKNGYVYNLKPLEEEDSKKLLHNILKDPIPGFDQNLELIVEKFDGHPLSLVSVANYLLKQHEFPKNFWQKLGDLMRVEPAFSELQHVLQTYFDGLQGDCVNLKVLLLYICVFPNTHPVRRSRLIRRWLAQGYVEVPKTAAKPVAEHMALSIATDETVKKLFDLNIIRSIDPSKNENAKTFRAHGIMHEFLQHIARSINFIADLRDSQRSKYRHLFLDGQISICHEQEKLRAHSLTIRGSAGEAVGYFPKCELLRVLDLEECNELEDRHTVDIHKLWHLKYLSLGAKITEVPSDIKKMHCLETLDMRKTQIKILPVEVIKLPRLAHLLGKFKLEKVDWENIKPERLLPPKSNLRTLAGFLADDDPGLPKLMVHMKELNKAKIWCNFDRANASTTDSTSSRQCFDALLEAIKLFITSRFGTPEADHCLSLDLGNSSTEILTAIHSSPEITCSYLSSLKLQGELCGLTQIITFVSGLKELCLSSTNGLTLDEVSKLKKLKALEYLKLVNISLGVITADDFKILRRLCLVECPGHLNIVNGALPNLLSLRILNKDLEGLSDIEIENLKILQEVGLHSEVKETTKTDWVDAAKKHPKRPRVLFFKMADSAERPPDTGSSVMLEEQQILTDVQSMVEVQSQPTAQENRDDEISSDSQNSNTRGSNNDDVNGKNEINNNGLTDEEAKRESKRGLVIKDVAIDGSRCATVESPVTSAVDNSLGQGIGKVDDAIQVNEDKECSGSRPLGKMVADDGLKAHDDRGSSNGKGKLEWPDPSWGV